VLLERSQRDDGQRRLGQLRPARAGQGGHRGRLLATPGLLTAVGPPGSRAESRRERRAVGGTGVLSLLPSEAECRAGVVAPRVSDGTALGIGSP
jgi:hypothetical protein